MYLVFCVFCFVLFLFFLIQVAGGWMVVTPEHSFLYFFLTGDQRVHSLSQSFSKYLWPNVGFILENIPYVLEKNAPSGAVGRTVCKCLSGPFGLKYSSSLMVSY